MLIVEIFRYLKRRADKRPVYLKNFVDQGHHHGTRTVEPSVEIIIPTRDKFELLHACIESVINKTTYKNYSITVVNNQSIEPETLNYLADLQTRGVQIIDYPHKFNYSAICNLAAEKSPAEYLCFLNNDTEVIEPDWMSFMVDHAVQPGVGVVGSKLLYPDGTIQHLGVALGYTGTAGHAYSRQEPNLLKPADIGSSCFEVSAATFACVVIRNSIFQKLGGLDFSFAVGLNDIEYCVRSAIIGSKSVVCGLSCLTHHESKTRGKSFTLKKTMRASLEVVRLGSRIKKKSLADAYFSHEA